MAEPDNLVLSILREMRAEMKTEFADVRSEMKTLRADLTADINSLRADLTADVNSLRADVASDMLTLEKRLGERIAGLQRAVMEYHSSTIGHGVLISEIDERLRRVERHLNLPPVEAH